MKKSITVHQKKRGRPATGRDPAVTIRLPEDVLASVEHWAVTQEDQPSRSQAIRQLVELGLKAKGKWNSGVGCETQSRLRGPRCSWWGPSHFFYPFWSRSISVTD